jgi:4-carboxymuconolactone decarboxylase
MKSIFGLTILFLLITFPSVMNAQNKTMDTQSSKTENQTLNSQQKSIVKIAALTAKGDLERLQTALGEGLDAKLTVNQIKDVLVQMYAYAGFPRSLNGLNTFKTVLDERKAKGITDTEGKTATPIDDKGDKYERGRKTLEVLSGQPQSKPAKGFGEFSPQIDRFLKEHLFADIFDSDVLTYQERELGTISALAAMPGVESQLESHISIGMNTGLTESQLKQVFDLIEQNISQEQASTARKSLAKITAAKQKK